jgi:hypothetical protein
MGVDADPRAGQAVRARGGLVKWDEIRISEVEALSKLRALVRGPAIPIAVDLIQLDGRPGYDFHLQSGREFWVDAVDSAVRAEVQPGAVARVAQRVMGPRTRILSIDRIQDYDTYYYARHGREMHLPAWRIRFDDPAQSVLYLNTVTGNPVGFVDSDTRLWRWLRHSMHSLDFHALIFNRPLWDAIVLPLMIGGIISSFTGVWLLVRRLRRMNNAH